MTPAEAGARDWIAEAPHLIDVLDWHQGLCRDCSWRWHCAEYQEIIAEYGAGVYGTAVFSPDATP